MKIKRIVRSSLIVTLSIAMATAAMLLSSPNQAMAVSCSGHSCDGKDPIYTGCNQNAYLAKRYPIYDTYGIFTGQYTDVYYSRSCGTNWLRVTGNPYGGVAYKMIQSLNSNGTVHYTEVEKDTGYGSSYSMMVYAPGSTRIEFYGKLFDKSNKSRAWTGYMTLQ